MKKRPGIYKRGKIYWIAYTWQGRQYLESTHSSNIHDADTLLLRRKTELMAGRSPKRQSLTLTVNELLNTRIMKLNILRLKNGIDYRRELCRPIAEHVASTRLMLSRSTASKSSE